MQPTPLTRADSIGCTTPGYASYCDLLEEAKKSKEDRLQHASTAIQSTMQRHQERMDKPTQPDLKEQEKEQQQKVKQQKEKESSQQQQHASTPLESAVAMSKGVLHSTPAAAEDEKTVSSERAPRVLERPQSVTTASILHSTSALAEKKGQQVGPHSAAKVESKQGKTIVPESEITEPSQSKKREATAPAEEKQVKQAAATKEVPQHSKSTPPSADIPSKPHNVPATINTDVCNEKETIPPAVVLEEQHSKKEETSERKGWSAKDRELEVGGEEEMKEAATGESKKRDVSKKEYQSHDEETKESRVSLTAGQSFEDIAAIKNGMTPLERHTAWFDTDNDGYVSIPETYRGFRRMGFNILIALLGVFFINVFLSWPSQGFWPDPRFRVRVKSIHRALHGSDSGIYNPQGNLTLERYDQLFGPHEKEKGKSGGLSLWELWQFVRQNSNLVDPFGWCASRLEWLATWLLAADENGILHFDAIKGVYDGTLFEVMAQQYSRQASNERQITTSNSNRLLLTHILGSCIILAINLMQDIGGIVTRLFTR